MKQWGWQERVIIDHHALFGVSTILTRLNKSRVSAPPDAMLDGRNALHAKNNTCQCQKPEIDAKRSDQQR